MHEIFRFKECVSDINVSYFVIVVHCDVIINVLLFSITTFHIVYINIMDLDESFTYKSWILFLLNECKS